jgi:deazaflavin-dependent oxidoreductase (nitroreductase family)
VLATCGIRPPEQAFEITQSRLSRLANSEEEEYNRTYSPAHLHKRITYTLHAILTFITRLTSISFQSLHRRFADWTKPSIPALISGTLTDLTKGKSELVAENALLRQQLIILRRQVKRPACTKTDRILLVLLARMVRTWKQALFIVQPQTLLRWHRQGFKLYWKDKSRAAAPKPKISTETVGKLSNFSPDIPCSQHSGAQRDTGLFYFRDGEHFIIIAAAAGAEKDPIWWLNLKSNPQAKIQIGDQIIPVVARKAEGEERQRLWSIIAEKYKNFVAYQKRTTSELPVVILTSQT